MKPQQMYSISEIASANYGVISRAQARSCGLSNRQIDHLVATGYWKRAFRGVYLIAGGARSPRTPLAIALAATGALASHRSAAEIHGLITSVPPVPEIVMSPSARYSGPAIAWRTGVLERSDRACVGGLPVTSVERTLFDLAAVLPEFEVEGMVHRALSARLANRQQVFARFDELASRGRSGTAAMRRILERIAPDDATMESHVELRLLSLLRAHGVPLPEPQVEVRIGPNVYRLDFAYRAERIFLEGDGYGIHTRSDVFDSDRVRQNALVVAGWMPLRYSDRTLRTTAPQVAREVLDALALRAPRADLAAS